MANHGNLGKKTNLLAEQRALLWAGLIKEKSDPAAFARRVSPISVLRRWVTDNELSVNRQS
jgi:hypothetical protein